MTSHFFLLNYLLKYYIFKLQGLSIKSYSEYLDNLSEFRFGFEFSNSDFIWLDSGIIIRI